MVLPKEKEKKSSSHKKKKKKNLKKKSVLTGLRILTVKSIPHHFQSMAYI